MVRRRRLQQVAVQPRHQRTSPARLVVQAVHADHRPEAGPLHRRGLYVGTEEFPFKAKITDKKGRTKIVDDVFTRPTTRAATSARPRSQRRRPTPTTPSTPSSDSRSARGTWRRPRTTSASTPISPATPATRPRAGPSSLTTPALILGGLSEGVTRWRWPTPTRRWLRTAIGSRHDGRFAGRAQRNHQGDQTPRPLEGRMIGVGRRGCSPFRARRPPRPGPAAG